MEKLTAVTIEISGYSKSELRGLLSSCCNEELSRVSKRRDARYSFGGNLRVTPHVAQNLGRRGGSAIDGRTTRHSGYAISQKKRKRIEECFGWLKTIALMRKVRHRGVSKVHWIFTLACAAYNLVRMRNLATAVPAV